MIRSGNASHWIGGLCVLTLLAAAPVAARTPEQTARDLLAKSGNAGGVAVVIGGDANLAAELAAQNERLVVQALYVAESAVRSARKVLLSRGLHGQASADRLRGMRLPYAEHLVNLVIVEGIGGVRNWDYRYTWIRDAAFTLYAFIRVGFTDEATAFGQYLRNRIMEPEADGSLQIMYGIDGRHELVEETLDHLEGYRGSRPVRIGNGAYNQLQLDIYGELLDSIYLADKYGTAIGFRGWKVIVRIVDFPKPRGASWRHVSLAPS